MPPLRSLRRHRALAPLALVSVLATLGLSAGAPSRGVADVESRIQGAQATATALQDQVSADSAQIARTTGGLAAAQARLARLQRAAAARALRLYSIEQSLIVARNQLTALENRLEDASHALAANLLATYEGQTPNVVTVVLDAHGFSDLLERLDFLHRIGDADADIVHSTESARRQVTHEADYLGGLEVRDRALAQAVEVQRNQAAALQAALARAQIAELHARARTSAQLDAVQGRLHSLEAQEAAIIASADEGGPTGSPDNAPGANPSIQIDTGGMVQPPPGAPAAVAEVIAAGNAIATLPYVYGGGHASFHADAYDCSGSVSYALAAAGLVSTPLDSTEFESWGEPGPGKWITVYANAVHAFMYVAGWRFDTVALAESGTRWASTPADTAGFVARHPPGL